MRSKTVGPRGPKGAHGQRGEQGQRGERGPAGPPPARAVVLAAVEEQFGDIRRQLEVQLTRFGQIQAQLDHLQKLFTQLMKEKD